ncbi:MAG: response regulator [Terriglobales bacterium]
MKILLVDDNETMRRAMRSVIQQDPTLRVCGEAADGQAAVEEFRKLRPDLVILDYSMPNKNGVETALEISAIAPEVPIVLCTMYGSEQVRKEALTAGIKVIIAKSENVSGQLQGAIKAITHR